MDPLLLFVIQEFAASLLFMTPLVAIGLGAIWSKRSRRQSLLEKDLLPYFSLADIRKSTEYYVPTHFQSNPPSQQSELIQTHKITARQKLMPFFLGTAFTPENEGQRFYMILAGSGMGKTTFMINLYLRYLQQRNGQKASLAIKLLPLGYPDVLKQIDLVEDPKQTILLLDGLDEDPQAVRRYKQRLERILNKVKDFPIVVFTCRTQFFPSEEDEPRDTGIIHFDTRRGYHSFAKMYLSPFDETDIKLYLRKRYGLFRGSKKTLAAQIVNQSPNLMVRPMLLSYIDDLLEEHTSFDYLSDLYRVLIQKWIEREAVRVPEDRRDVFREELYRFSREVALNIYANRKHRKGLFIGEKEIKSFAEKHQIKLEEMELKSRSLLNRNMMGQYKFAHKSILEYFLAMECVENPRFASKFSFENMDQARLFFDERCLLDTTLPFFHAQKEDATCKLEGDEVRLLNTLNAAEIANIRVLTFRTLKSLEPIRPLRKLKELYIDQTAIKNLQAVAELEQLEVLSVSKTVVDDISPLANLALLKVLHAGHTRIHKLHPLRELGHVHTLHLSHTPVSVLEGVQGLTRMETLMLSHTHVKDLEPLRKMKALKVLRMDETPLVNLGPIRELDNLTELDVCHTQVANLTALRNLKKLTYLGLSFTRTSNLKPLKQLKALRTLYLDETEVKDLQPLSALSNLEELSIKGVSASGLQALTSLTRLKKVTLTRRLVDETELSLVSEKLPQTNWVLV